MVAVFFSKYRSKAVIFTQNVENYEVSLNKSTTSQVQQFLNAAVSKLQGVSSCLGVSIFVYTTKQKYLRQAPLLKLEFISSPCQWKGHGAGYI